MLLHVVGWHAAAADPRGPRAAIAAIFDATAASVIAAPRVIGEVIAVQARLTGKAAIAPVSALEKRLAFPDRPGVEAIDAMGLEGLLPPRIAAVYRQQLAIVWAGLAAAAGKAPP
jgi:hypothetical protein